MHQRIKSIVIMGVLLSACITVSCEDYFEDETMSLLKKPEILSIVLEPPQASPGDTVSARFIFADSKGPITDGTWVWLPGGADQEVSGEIFDSLGITLDDLEDSTLTFIVPELPDDAYDENGFAAFSIGLAVAIDADDGVTAEQLVTNLDDWMTSDKALVSIRTLVVSKYGQPSVNPVLNTLTWNPEDTGEAPVVCASLLDENFTELRQSAADNPMVVTEKTKIHFNAQVSNDIDTLFQWISTGGDFQGYRDAIQPWKTPAYKELESGDVDQTDVVNSDPRLDPNLHAVWLVLRDDGTPTQLGQNLIEFYVRVIPSE